MAATIQDARHLPGPFAVIGDVHNCVHTLETLLGELGGSLKQTPPELTLVSVGDLTDKGPEHGVVPILRWATEQTTQGKLHVVDSNHGARLARMLKSSSAERCNKKSNTWPTYRVLSEQLDSSELARKTQAMLEAAPAALRLTVEGKREIVVAHAAASERLLAKNSLSANEVRFHIASREFRWLGEADVVVGHVGVERPQVTRETRADGTAAGRVIRIDTNVDQGGYLTAYLPHEDRFLSVPTDPRDIAGKATQPRNLVTAEQGGA